MEEDSAGSAGSFPVDAGKAAEKSRHHKSLAEESARLFIALESMILTKEGLVIIAAQNQIGRFTKQNIRELCPSLSLSSVEGSLRKLVEEGELKRESKGKNTFCFRI